MVMGLKRTQDTHSVGQQQRMAGGHAERGVSESDQRGLQLN